MTETTTPETFEPHTDYPHGARLAEHVDAHTGARVTLEAAPGGGVLLYVADPAAPVRAYCAGELGTARLSGRYGADRARARASLGHPEHGRGVDEAAGRYLEALRAAEVPDTEPGRMPRHWGEYVCAWWVPAANLGPVRDGQMGGDGTADSWSVRWEHRTGRAWVTFYAWAVDGWHRGEGVPCDAEGTPAPEGQEDETDEAGELYGYLIRGRDDHTVGARETAASEAAGEWIAPRFYAEERADMSTWDLLSAPGEVETWADYEYGDGSPVGRDTWAAADADARELVAPMADAEHFARSFSWDGR